MSFTCPQCEAIQTLEIIRSITLPPDSRSDDILLQIVRCRQCGFGAAAIYEESRRGGLDSEAWDHRGYRIDQKTLASLDQLMRECPARQDKRCRCSSHRALTKTNDYGRWQPPFEANWQDAFPIRR